MTKLPVKQSFPLIMIDQKDIIFIINPSSGGKKVNKILKQLNELDSEIDYFVSHSKEAFNRFVESNIDQYKVFVICGGDGTINTTLKYLAKNEDKILAVLPNGSGDGFAHELGFKNNLEDLLQKIQLGQTKNVDLIKINNGYSCNMIGLGLDSHIASDFEKSKRRGLLNYVLATIRALFQFKRITAEIEVNNNIITGEYLMINVANTRQFGNNFYIAPDAKFDDGLLDLVLIKPLPVYYLPKMLYHMISGVGAASKYIQTLKASHLSITSNSKHYHVDGECQPMPDKLTISINSQFKIINTQ